MKLDKMLSGVSGWLLLCIDTEYAVFLFTSSVEEGRVWTFCGDDIGIYSRVGDCRIVEMSFDELPTR